MDTIAGEEEGDVLGRLDEVVRTTGLRLDELLLPRKEGDLAGEASAPRPRDTAIPHVPVLLGRVIECVEPRPGGVYVDATFGAGGYTRGLLLASENRAHVIGIDRDASVFDARVHELPSSGRFTLVHGRFGDMGALVRQALAPRHAQGRPREDALVDGVVFDLGVSSMQIDQAERGFSFRHRGPLDMRMSGGVTGRGTVDTPITAAHVVNEMSESILVDILSRYGEERFARRIARGIVVHREGVGRIEDTTTLAEVVRASYPPAARRELRIDPATRTFQALRIYVNDELGELLRGLQEAERLLRPGGILAVVAYHSLEDRLVKDFLRRCAQRRDPLEGDVRASLLPLNKDVIVADEVEIHLNARARSAKLRAARRTDAPPIAAEHYGKLATRA